ncbi:MAG TPA: sulfatase, partial [Phycisphaerales bacterium]|nr:sulfatase [Phycisphaerales bacterium]
YIHSHDTGRYIQPYGYAVPTPRMQRLAEQGMIFRQAFCAGPTCSPSRAGLLTGQSPHSCGLIGLTHRGFSLTDPSRHLAAFLGRNG